MQNATATHHSDLELASLLSQRTNIESIITPFSVIPRASSCETAFCTWDCDFSPYFWMRADFGVDAPSWATADKYPLCVGLLIESQRTWKTGDWCEIEAVIALSRSPGFGLEEL